MALVEAARFHDHAEALVVRSLLADHGIDSVPFDAGMNGYIGGIVPIRLMVLDDDLAEAQRLLAEGAGPWR